jgi:hypothetical protein
MSKLYPSVSGLSILMALALALGEWVFFYGGSWEGPLGLFVPNRLGFNLAWLTLVYLSFLLLSIPLAMGTRQRFIGVVDGMGPLPVGHCSPCGRSLVALVLQWRQDHPNNRPPTRASAISAMGQLLS